MDSAVSGVNSALQKYEVRFDFAMEGGREACDSVCVGGWRVVVPVRAVDFRVLLTD